MRLLRSVVESMNNDIVVSFISSAILFSKVVLPEPIGPSKTTKLFSNIAVLTSSIFYDSFETRTNSATCSPFASSFPWLVS